MFTKKDWMNGYYNNAISIDFIEMNIEYFRLIEKSDSGIMLIQLYGLFSS